MKKYLLIGGTLTGLLGGLIGGHAQVKIQYVNMSKKDIVISVPIYDIQHEFIPAKSNGNVHFTSVVRTNDEIMILKPELDHVNSNRAQADTAYTTGYWRVKLFYNEKKKRWYSRVVE